MHTIPVEIGMVRFQMAGAVGDRASNGSNIRLLEGLEAGIETV